MADQLRKKDTTEDVRHTWSPWTMLLLPASCRWISNCQEYCFTAFSPQENIIFPPSPFHMSSDDLFYNPCPCLYDPHGRCSLSGSITFFWVLAFLFFSSILLEILYLLPINAEVVCNLCRLFQAQYLCSIRKATILVYTPGPDLYLEFSDVV